MPSGRQEFCDEIWSLVIGWLLIVSFVTVTFVSFVNILRSNRLELKYDVFYQTCSAVGFVLFATVRLMLDSVSHLVAHGLISGHEFLRNLFIRLWGCAVSAFS